MFNSAVRSGALRRTAQPALASTSKRTLRTSPFVTVDQSTQAGTSASHSTPTSSNLSPLNYQKQVDQAMDDSYEPGHHREISGGGLAGQSDSLNVISGFSQAFKRVPLGAYRVSTPYEEDAEGAAQK